MLAQQRRARCSFACSQSQPQAHSSSSKLLDCSIPQCLSRFQRELNPLLRLALAAERLEAFTFQVKQVLLAYWSPRGDASAAQHLGHFVANLYFVIADVLALAHQENPQLKWCQNIFTRRSSNRPWNC